jgi:hypothetical protein
MTLFGLGLRKQHFEAVLSGNVKRDFVEVNSENFMFSGGRPLADLLDVRAKCPVALHGVSMSVGSATGLDRDCVLGGCDRPAVYFRPFMLEPGTRL